MATKSPTIMAKSTWIIIKKPAVGVMHEPLMFIRDFKTLRIQIHAALPEFDVLFVGVCGPSGSGKTTLCRKIIEALPMQTYRLDCDRFSVHDYAERERRISTALANSDANQIALEENPCHWCDWQSID
ncbi:AAA family ATPase [Paraburkholderia aspalathi]|nr:AAA family ATPase [Paraburkholderia aspalathi]